VRVTAKWGSQDFYKRFGFQEVGRFNPLFGFKEAGRFNPLTDSVDMVLELDK